DLVRYGKSDLAHMSPTLRFYRNSIELIDVISAPSRTGGVWGRQRRFRLSSMRLVDERVPVVGKENPGRQQESVFCAALAYDVRQTREIRVPKQRPLGRKPATDEKDRSVKTRRRRREMVEHYAPIPVKAPAGHARIPSGGPQQKGRNRPKQDGHPTAAEGYRSWRASPVEATDTCAKQLENWAARVRLTTVT
ncbi:MAG: hypothetical protein ACRD3O_18320, partial [Terriglobia bacterium]